MRWIYARALYTDEGASLDDLRESVEILESVAKIRGSAFSDRRILRRRRPRLR